MAEKSSAVRTGLIAAGAAAVAAFVTVFTLGAFGSVVDDILGNTTTAIRLRYNTTSRACELVGKETGVIVKKGKKVIWKIVNTCTTDETVTLGNFRKPSTPPSPSTCEAGGAWPFDEVDTRDNRQRMVPAGKSRDLKLKAGIVDILDFDICLGVQNGTKVDPRLIIDP